MRCRVVLAVFALAIGCGKARISAYCGDGVVNNGEECDDANTSDRDFCRNTCVLPRCGDGFVSATESCDDGNRSDNDACRNDCTTWITICGNEIVEPGEFCEVFQSGCSDDCRSRCGDGVIEGSEVCEQDEVNCSADCMAQCGNSIVEDDEQCDDGNRDNTDSCTTDCTSAACGDGYVQQGEECDDGEQNGIGPCEDDCTVDPCVPGLPIYMGEVSNDEDPTAPGPGVTAVWAYAGNLGIGAGDDMCQQIGAAGACTYGQVEAANQAGELDSLSPGTRFWLHRVNETVLVPETNTLSPPGPGGRCNDWTYDGFSSIADSEWGGVATDGTIYYYFDSDTVYTGNPPDGHGGPHYEGEIGAPGTGHGGSCHAGTAEPKSILCCSACGLP